MVRWKEVEGQPLGGALHKSQMNDRISSDLESHRGGELVPAINAALSDSVPKTTLSARLQQDHIDPRCQGWWQ